MDKFLRQICHAWQTRYFIKILYRWSAREECVNVVAALSAPLTTPSHWSIGIRRAARAPERWRRKSGPQWHAVCRNTFEPPGRAGIPNFRSYLTSILDNINTSPRKTCLTICLFVFAIQCRRLHSFPDICNGILKTDLYVPPLSTQQYESYGMSHT